MTDTKRIFICGSALTGQPDHDNLQAAKLIRSAQTRPQYRLHAAVDGWHPAIYQVEQDGISIPGEVYEMTIAEYEYLLAHEPPHLYPGDIVLADGEVLTAMLYPRSLVEKHGWTDISDFGGWAAYKAQAQAG